MVVAVKIRDTTLFVLHDTKALTICFNENNIHDEFLAFVEILKKDIETLQKDENPELEQKRKTENEKTRNWITSPRSASRTSSNMALAVLRVSILLAGASK